jgi:hypothetical protein
MKNRLLTLFLLLSLSLNIVHAYVIEAFDTHSCQVNEYVHEFNESSEMADDDICHIHHFFHTAFIVPINEDFISEIKIEDRPLATQSSYTYNNLENFLKPPIL